MDISPKLLKNRHFWIVVVMLVICSFFHYFAPQIPLLSSSGFPMVRQAVVRIIFLLPVAAAAFAFGRSAGLITMAVVMVIMLPRAFFISQQPLDALLEIAGVTVVGCILVWMIDVQEKEKALRQEVVEKLETVNAVALTLTERHDLDAMLDKALTKVLEVTGLPEPRGAILLLDPLGECLNVRAYQGMSPEFAKRAVNVPLAECLCGLTAEAGDVLVVRNATSHPRHTRCMVQEPHTHVCVPLKSKARMLGVMDFYLPASHPVGAIDEEMYGAIGRQVGVAVENARLCENLRFYVQQVTRAQEDERRRIARDLHDDTAQRLIALSRRIDTLLTSGEILSEAGAEELEQLQQRIEEILQGVRRFSRDLRPSVLDDLGLLPAIEGLLTDVRESGLAAELEISGDRRRLSPSVELGLFRIIQEALNNVVRHADASQVEVAIQFGNAGVRATVRDDGLGFELLASTSDFATIGRFGLVGIEERTQLLRGLFQVQSAPGQGTTVRVDVPA